MNKYKTLFVSGTAALFLVASAFAADSNDAWAVSLGGVGSTDLNSSATALGVNLEVGRTGKVLLPVEVGLRQGVAYADGNTILNTGVYSDVTLLTVKNTVDLFVGGNVGAQYGNCKTFWTVAPEAGVRVWVKRDVAILARVDAPVDLEEWDFLDTTRYFVGFQVKFR